MFEIRVKTDDTVSNIKSESNALLSDVLNADSVHLFCGGNGKCGKCKIRVSGEVSPVTTEEEKLLTTKELSENVRLSCLCKVVGNCEVILPSVPKSMQIQSSGEISDITENVKHNGYSVAVDIGTTTIVVKLFNEGTLVSTCSEYNNQRKYGADVISRIEYAMNDGLNRISNCVREQLKAMINSALGEVQASSLSAIYITGNTTMLYLLKGLNPVGFSKAPFIADELFGEYLESRELNFHEYSNTVIYLAKSISAFVGADITCACVSADLCGDSNKTNLLVDIGTNGEIVLWHNSKLYCCSTAAGPTFEGADITHGMNGVSGAIEHIWVNDGEVEYKTINNEKAKGICGSGIIDAIAVMVDLEIIDETGFMEDDEFEIGEGITITDKDVRSVQLAKSAICAGILSLLDYANITADEVDNFFIAGGFGSYIDTENAAKIGLFPHKLLKKVSILGNAALSGCIMLMTSSDYTSESENISNIAETIELSTSTVFMENYVECMMF